jgi:sodium/bile acid cotransporter 7
MNFARAAGLLRDHWFLAVVALGIAVCLVVPEWVAFVLIPVQPRRVVVVMMFLTAFSLETRILLHRTIHPWPVFLAVGVSYGIVPLLGWLGSVPLGLLGPPDLGIGLIVISCVPCTLASAVVWTRMARGDEGTVLLTTIATTCTSWIFTSLWLQLTIGKALTLDLPALMFDLLLILVAPLAVGQMARLSTPLRTFAQNRKP